MGVVRLLHKNHLWPDAWLRLMVGDKGLVYVVAASDLPIIWRK